MPGGIPAIARSTRPSQHQPNPCRAAAPLVSDAVLVLIPPSEGKTPPARGRRLSWTTLGFPTLTPTRRSVLAALVDISRGSRSRALKVLGISERLADELQRNAELEAAPCAPAVEVYTGVLFEALDWTSLPAPARRRAGQRLSIASALWGLVGAQDPIPAYRLSADTTLPGLGPLRRVWSEVLPHALETAAGRGIVVDLRSAAYVQLGPVPAALAPRTAQARVLTLRAGKKVVVSHHNKATKGHLVRSLLLATTAPRSIPELGELLRSAGHEVEVHSPRRPTDPWQIDVIVDGL